jgi:predicted metal-dependent phosphoesterase TrpH
MPGAAEAWQGKIQFMNVDLHCHSTVSDGLLRPSELVRRAAANGVNVLALTDHDELGGLAEARAAAEAEGMRFVDGVEVSVSWDDDTTVHIVGLGVDPDDAALREGLAQVRSGRDSRAGRMAEALDRVGIHGAYEGALRYAGNPALLGRSHFARYIVECGLARDVKSVFDHWLAKDKPGYVRHGWAELGEALQWIRSAGGVAVMAHPGRYRITAKQLAQLLAEFKELGGSAIEVVSGSHDGETGRVMAKHARNFGLAASRASDFHGPGESWTDLGRMPELPEGLVPVWQELV